MEKILGFFGEYRFLSNFWPAKVILNDKEYPTVENAYQAAKTMDLEKREIIRACTPEEAKKVGEITRDDWEEAKLSIMGDLVRQKFTNPELAKLLKDTGDAYLEETNYWNDTFWGVCKGKGYNHLGKILMKVRESL